MTADTPATGVSGQFVTMHGERYYAIRNVDRMEPFFVSVVSDSDHWLFAASNGGLTAGRVSPDTALFPYITVDKIYDSTLDTGPRTFIRVHRGDTCSHWEPFNRQHDSHYTTERNLYKNLLGNKLLFEEINHDLGLAFRYGWSFSDSFGFVRRTEVAELAGNACRLELLDGVQNILPAGTPRFTQTNSSYLVDAYKWSELDEQTGLALYSLFSAISDRAEPCESLRTTTAFCLGLDSRGVLLSTTQVERFRGGGDVRQETLKRGVRGAYFVDAEVPLAGGATAAWQIVTNVEQTQAEAVKLIQRLADPEAVARKIEASIAAGSDALARIQAAADAYQTTAEETVSAHHYANVLYNVLRGGIVDDQYRIDTGAFAGHLALFNAAVAGRYEAWLDALPDKLDHAQLMEAVREQNDAGLTRLALEYLPITFGRRHGDPSRPWNQFAIRLTDSEGNRLLTYQGNWRDIFQNWEALLLSYPQFVDSIIAKFVNASTIDGYNPYRITNEGFDWEVEEPDDPWSYIGYWGDHQIIYLQKLLELSRQFHPDRLDELLHEPLFCYANVPYRIRSFDRIVANPKTTVDYDDDLAARIEVRVSELGADGKLVMNPAGEVCQVNLLEKLLVTLLAKLGNLVIDGGIWLNTQRPEWNDANNALVGQGLSMVTLYYMRRYVRFLARLLSDETRQTRLSSEVGRWLAATAAALAQARGQLGEGPVDPEARHRLLTELGEAASRYRETVYQQGWPGEAVAQDIEPLRQLLEDATAAIDHSIRSNRRDDGLYHAYNLLELEGQSARVDTLYPMLEGQVAALSSGAIPPAEAVSVLEALFASEVYRADQHTFLLYPDRDLPCFLEKNRVPADGVAAIPLLTEMEKRGDTRLVERDAGGTWRFHADLTNVDSLGAALPGRGELWLGAGRGLRRRRGHGARTAA